MNDKDQIDLTGKPLAAAIQNALDSLMLEMKPRDSQQIGDILAMTILRMTEMVAALGSREEAVKMIEIMIPHIRKCTLPLMQLQGADLTHVAKGTNTKH